MNKRKYEDRVVIAKLDNTCSEIITTTVHLHSISKEPNLVFCYNQRFFLLLKGQQTDSTDANGNPSIILHYTEIPAAAAMAVLDATITVVNKY